MPESSGFKFFKGIRLLLACILIVVPLEAVLIVLVPLGVWFYCDEILPRHEIGRLFRFLASLSALAVAGALAGILRDYLTSSARSRAFGRLRQAMFECLQRILLSDCGSEGEGGVLDRFSGDAGVMESSAAAMVPFMLLPLAQALLCTAAVFWLDWRLGIASLLLWLWTSHAPEAAAVHAATAREDLKEQTGVLVSAVRQTLASLSTVRLYSLEQTGAADFGRRSEAIARRSVQANFRAAFMDRLSIAGLLAIHLLLLAMSMMFSFQGSMGLGALAAIQILGSCITGRLLAFAGCWPEFGRATTAWRRIDGLLASGGAAVDAPSARALPPLQSEIGFFDVTFAYEPGKNQITGLTARIPRGAFVAIVGPSGTGKSTLLKLLMRLYDPVGGRITIDGHDLRSVTQASLRAQQGFVLQQNSLFNTTIRDNIRLGMPGASAEAVVRAAQKVGLHDEIMKLPQNYDTVADNRSVRFSPAARQRIALARILLRKPEILLLDEATSALDPVEEAALNEIIEDMRKGRTVISASHRLSTTAHADHIFVLDGGRIVEQGTHFELIARGGAYAWLWRKQAGFRFRADGVSIDVDADRLKAFPILEDLGEAALSELAPFLATETFQPGREIVRQNDPGDKFYIIARGKVEVRRTEEASGNTMELAILQDGDFFGEITLLTGFPRTATVQSLTVCTCLTLTRGHFNRLLDRFPDLKRRMSAVAVQRLRESAKAGAV